MSWSDGPRDDIGALDQEEEGGGFARDPQCETCHDMSDGSSPFRTFFLPTCMPILSSRRGPESWPGYG